MALVIIEIQDKADGSVDVRLATEPRMDGPRAKYTMAEEMGATALNAIHGMLEEKKVESGPKLIVVGADELPH